MFSIKVEQLVEEEKGDAGKNLPESGKPTTHTAVSNPKAQAKKTTSIFLEPIEEEDMSTRRARAGQAPQVFEITFSEEPALDSSPFDVVLPKTASGDKT